MDETLLDNYVGGSVVVEYATRETGVRLPTNTPATSLEKLLS